MAFTRLYLTQASAPYTPATIRGAWDETSTVVTRALSPVASETAALTTVTGTETSLTDEWDILLYRGVSGPLAAQTISGTIDIRIGLQESALSANFCTHLHVYVTQGDSDTPRGTLLADYREVLTGNEWSTSGTSSARGLASAQALSSLGITAGDRLVVEIGCAARNTVATSHTATLRYGARRGYIDNAITDSTGTNPFLVFSVAIAEVPADTRVTQLVVETMAPHPAVIRVTQLVVEVASAAAAAAAVPYITTRTDRAVFPTTAVIGGSDLPTLSTLRLSGLPPRDPGQDFLSVDSEGHVYQGILDASELPPAAFAVEPVARTIAPQAIATTPRGRISGILRYGFATATTEPPSSSTVRLDAGFPYTGVTRLWAHHQSTQSEDMYWDWMRVTPGASILIQDRDTHAQFVDLEATGAPIDRGSYAEIPVRVIAAGSALATQECIIGITWPAPPVGLSGAYTVTWYTASGQPIGRLQLTFDRGACVDLQPRTNPDA